MNDQTILPVNASCYASFGSGQCFEFGGFVAADPLVLVPEGGVCRVESVHRRQRCISCGNMSWTDETITCPGCQSQVFEDV